MKTGTTILLIILLLFGSFATLGYFYSQFSVLQSENQELRQQNEALNVALNDARKARQVDQQKIDELTAKVQNLTLRLNEEISARQYYAGLVRTCENNRVGSSTGLPLFSAIAAPALVGLLYAGLKLAGKPRGRKQKITLRMTREQLDEYIRFQRGGGRKPIPK